jgi:hypothetical protein
LIELLLHGHHQSQHSVRSYDVCVLLHCWDYSLCDDVAPAKKCFSHVKALSESFFISPFFDVSTGRDIALRE